MSTEDKIKVMQAYAEGKMIQFRTTRGSHWITTDNSNNEELSWNWGTMTYRIKPVPMKIWVNCYSDTGLLCAHTSSEIAEKYASAGCKIRHFIEVLDEEDT